VQRLEREPGKRESRYAQLFTPLPESGRCGGATAIWSMMNRLMTGWLNWKQKMRPYGRKWPSCVLNWPSCADSLLHS